MTDGEIVSGQLFAWCLNEKLGEGDAGEVYQVESLVGGQSAILKRPSRSAFSGDMFRQSAQIRTEGWILKALHPALAQDPELGVAVPALLDQSKNSQGGFNDRSFIILEKAPGLALGFLGRVTQLGLSELESDLSQFTSLEQLFLQSIARTQKIPESILIKILQRLVNLLDKIHTQRVSEDNRESFGIVWNDVKPDHLFWDLQNNLLTVIDWGNSRFLEADRTTSDRQFSWMDDYRQLFEEGGRFLDVTAPELSLRLEWPSNFSVENASLPGIEALKARLDAALQAELEKIRQARAAEEALLQSGTLDETLFAELEAIQATLLEVGELPDYAGAVRMASGIAARLVELDKLEELRRLGEWAAILPGSDQYQWRLITDLARIPGRSQGEPRQCLLNVLQSAICKDWEGAMWALVQAIQGFPEPDWWADITARLRWLALGIEADSVRPLVSIRRLSFALQASARRLEDLLHKPGANDADFLKSLEGYQSLVRYFKEEAIPAWVQLDPDPPDCSLLYTQVETVLAGMNNGLAEEQKKTLAQLAYARNEARLILDAWGSRDFMKANQGLRRLLLWDPDRWRVLHAEHAILAAPDFLKKVHLGPQHGDNFPEWITSLELQGRQLRNRVGPAGWLDAILDSCKQIRKGTWPSDLLRSEPHRLAEMPWLRKFERSERVPAAVDGQTAEALPVKLEYSELHGVVESWLGPEGGLTVISPLDTWMAEARGSSARVVLGELQCANSLRQAAAIKLMRMEQVNYALPLFKEEVIVLNLMHNVPGVANLLECGFIQLEEGSVFPLSPTEETAPATGRVVRIGLDAHQEFLDQIQPRISDGWTPYLAIEKQAQEDSLLLLCDSGMTRGQYLPVITLLQMGIQISDILQVAHERNIVYRDHKILHYYWQAHNNGLYIIDWNVARYHPQGLTATEIEMDLVQFGARGLHHILTGRTAPGALPLGPTRPEEIEQAAASYQTQWTYDDQRLSAGVRSILERILAGEFKSAAALSDVLKRTLMQLPDARL